MENTQEFIDALIENILDPTLQLPDPTLVQYYEDLANRTIWINTEINGDMLNLVSKIIKWNKEDKDKPVESRNPIKLLFLSPGGSLEVEEVLVSIIQLSKTPIYGIALGGVASAASVIYLNCHKRFALPNAYFIFHQGSCENIGGTFNTVMAAMEDYKQAIEKMTIFYINNTTYSEEEVRQHIEGDWYIYPQEALEHGIVTDIIKDIEVLF